MMYSLIYLYYIWYKITKNIVYVCYIIIPRIAAFQGLDHSNDCSIPSIAAFQVKIYFDHECGYKYRKWTKHCRVFF